MNGKLYSMVVIISPSVKKPLILFPSDGVLTGQPFLNISLVIYISKEKRDH